MAYVNNNHFQAHASNTICDVSGFKKKTTEVVKRWDGFEVIPDASHPRQPQDFPPHISKTQVFNQARFEQVIENTEQAFPEII